MSALDDDHRAFLAVAMRGTLFANRRDGTPTGWPMTLLWQGDDHLYVNTYRKAAKAHVLRRDGRVAVVAHHDQLARRDGDLVPRPRVLGKTMQQKRQSFAGAGFKDFELYAVGRDLQTAAERREGVLSHKRRPCRPSPVPIPTNAAQMRWWSARWRRDRDRARKPWRRRRVWPPSSPSGSRR